MILSIEGLAGKQEGYENVKLEEQVLITGNGPEILSHAPFSFAQGMLQFHHLSQE